MGSGVAMKNLILMFSVCRTLTNLLLPVLLLCTLKAVMTDLTAAKHEDDEMLKTVQQPSKSPKLSTLLTIKEAAPSRPVLTSLSHPFSSWFFSEKTLIKTLIK